MDQKQSFNLTADFLNGFSSHFMNLVLIIIVVYMIIMILNFLRDKFISKNKDPKKDDILDLLTILNKLFFVSGFGFILANLIQAFVSQGNHGMASFYMRGSWNNLTFGIIIIFIGIGLKVAKNVLKKDRAQ